MAKSINEMAVTIAKELEVMTSVIADRKNDVLTDEAFKANKDYKALLDAKAAACKAVEDYEMKAVKANTAYNNAVLLTATKAVRAFGYRYNIDAMKTEEFLNSKAFAEKVAAHGQYLDTTARLASFVSSVYKDVSEKRVTVTKKTPLTISEIKLLLQMVAVGFMTREEARAKVAKGK